MKTLHTFAVHALLAPAIALGATTAMAQQPINPRATDQPTMPPAVESQRPTAQTQEYVNAIPAQGLLASKLIGAKVTNPDNENVGSVNDLLLDKDGKVVAVVVGVGGFLGMGERDVAVGWGHLMRSGSADKQKLQMNVTKESLRLAPEFKK